MPPIIRPSRPFPARQAQPETRERADPACRPSRQPSGALINWGYAMTDIAVRSYVDPKLPAATAFPYKIGVGA